MAIKSYLSIELKSLTGALLCSRMSQLSPDERAIRTYYHFRPLTLAEQRVFLTDPTSVEESRRGYVFSPQLQETYYEWVKENPLVRIDQLFPAAIPNLEYYNRDEAALLADNTFRYIQCKVEADRVLAHRKKAKDEGYSELTKNDLMYLANTGRLVQVKYSSSKSFQAVLLSDEEGNYSWKTKPLKGKEKTYPAFLVGVYIKYKKPPITPNPDKIGGVYMDSILKAIPGCSFEEAKEVESNMRHIIFHSTLDWLSPEEFDQGALEAWELYHTLKAIHQD